MSFCNIHHVFVRLGAICGLTALLAGAPVFAQVPGDKMMLLEGRVATVVTRHGYPSKCLAPVAITSIDENPVSVPAGGFTIEPGPRTVNGRARLDISRCPLPESGDIPGTAPGLVVDFEAGKTYFIGYDHSSPDPHEWTLLVWKVEEDLAQGSLD